MNIVFLYAGEILPERGGVQRVTHVLSDYFESKNLNIYYLALPNITDTIKTSRRQYFLPSKSDFEMNSAFYLKFLEAKKINLVVNQSGINPFISNLSYEASKIDIKVISVIHTSILTGIKNFSALYRSKAKKMNLAWVLPLADIKIINNLICYLYKIKYKSHYRALCNKSSKVILLSNKLKKELIYISGINKLQNVIAIPNPLSFRPENINIKNKKKELLYVGRVDTYHKRVDLLLDIWNRLYEKFPDWKLKIVGGGNELNEVMNYSKKLNLERVSFEGFQNPEPYYKRASIFCMTSSSESFGMVLLEAMQYGAVPFAFNSYLSVTDIIDDKKNGILISSFDCIDYAKQLEFIMNNIKIRKMLAENAIVKTAIFSVKEIGDLWIQIFETINLNKN